MRTYLARRLLGAVPLLLGIATISFVFMMVMPGGPDTMLARNSRMNAQQLSNVRRSMGLDQSVLVQYGRWILNLARGDLGLSFTRFQPVSQVISERVGPTLRLVSIAILISTALAIGLGVASALWRYSIFDYVTTTLSYIGLALPVFWLALMLQVIFALQLRLNPSLNQ